MQPHCTSCTFTVYNNWSRGQSIICFFHYRQHGGCIPARATHKICKVECMLRLPLCGRLHTGRHSLWIWINIRCEMPELFFWSSRIHLASGSGLQQGFVRFLVQRWLLVERDRVHSMQPQRDMWNRRVPSRLLWDKQHHLQTLPRETFRLSLHHHPKFRSMYVGM